MFHYDRGLKLTQAQLAVDFRRRQPRGFISHAHTDHMARHELALCTPDTSRLYQARFGKRPTLQMPYFSPLQFGGLTLTTYPAGHCLGSAMLLADNGACKLLYTGDFKLGPSATAQATVLPQADILVIECTFGKSQYRIPPRELALERLFTLVRQTLLSGATPVIEAYTLGKSQEVTRLLSDAGFPVLQHPKVFEISRVYEACGMSLGNYAQFNGRSFPGSVCVVPPRTRNFVRGPVVTFAVTGWAMDASAKYRLGVDHAIPLSDHADYDELLEAVRQVGAQEIYCTHGPESFADDLRGLGFNARPLANARQMQLF